MNTDLVKIDQTTSIWTNNGYDVKLRSLDYEDDDNYDITFLKTSEKISLSDNNEEEDYYISLAKLMESDIEILRLKGLKVSYKNKLTLSRVEVDLEGSHGPYVQCFYDGYDEDDKQEYLHTGQICTAKIINNIIIPKPSINRNSYKYE